MKITRHQGIPPKINRREPDMSWSGVSVGFGDFYYLIEKSFF
jgi:hypothetical protein